MDTILSSLAPPANFRIGSVPGTELPTTSIGGVPGLALSLPSGTDSGFLGANAGALRAQIEGGLVRNVAGLPSQQVVTSAYVARPWANGYHKRMGRGQLIFYKRGSSDGKTHTLATLPQINTMLREAYVLAQRVGVLERSNAYGDVDLHDDLLFAIEADMEDDVDRIRRMYSDESKRQMMISNSLQRISNTNERLYTSMEQMQALLDESKRYAFLRLLSLDGVQSTYNYIGALQNIEHTGKEFRVANTAVRGPLHVDKCWRGKMVQGQYLYLVLKRVYNASSDEYEEFQYVPWTQPVTIASSNERRRVQIKYPDTQDLIYEDAAGYEQIGKALMVGVVGNVMQSRGENDVRADRLAGLASGVRDTEMIAWRETESPNKTRLFITLGADAKASRFI